MNLDLMEPVYENAGAKKKIKIQIRENIIFKLIKIAYSSVFIII